MKKPVKIIFSVVLSVAMVLSLALTAYGASSLTFDFTVTVEKGKVFDENGDLYTGWYIKNRHKYYAESGRRVRGWKKIGKQYYYFAADYAMAKNKIVGSKSKGYYYVDKSGARVTANEIKMTVDFVMKNSNPASRQRNRLKQCFDALRKYPYVGKSDTPPGASQLPSYARYMFTRQCGDCYYYGITMAYIARVLGYDSRAAMGAVTAWGPAHPLSPHGWCEVRVDSGWKMIDCSMQNGHPDANLFFVGRNRYQYRLRCDKTYALNINNGKVSWR